LQAYPITVRYQKALDLCLQSLRSDPGRFYGPAGNLPLGTGMLVRDCVLALPHTTDVRFETGLGLALILTHECDVDQNNDRSFNDLVLACPIIPLEDFCEECEQDQGIGAWGGILPEIAGDNVYRAMYLPPPHNLLACPEMAGGGIIYLNHISPCRVEWFSNHAAQPVCSLSAIGLQAFDFKLRNHLFREKASRLWFGR
jgi:hypothetical protein